MPSNKFAWKRIHEIPNSSYAIDKRVWPQGPPDYRISNTQGTDRDAVPVRLGQEIERILAENAKLRAFVREWSERFGFLATENPRDSVKSIDEVARYLNREINPFGPTWHEFRGRQDLHREWMETP